jgi:hypothetical protein
MELTLDSTLTELLDIPQARAVLDKHLPGVTSNPMIGMVKNMSLNNILAIPQASQFGLTREKAQSVLDEINKAI